MTQDPTPTVTYRHYWTAEENGIHMRLEPDPEPVAAATMAPSEAPSSGQTEDALYEALRAKVHECDELRRRLAEHEGANG